MKNTLIIVGVVILLLAGSVWWSKSLRSSDPDVISTRGVHWHPQLEIYVKGEQISIPQNTGLGAVHQPMHTHDNLPIIHLEFSSLVTREDTKLKNFFTIWGKDMMTDFGTLTKMTVNGKETTEFGEYEMKDEDKIELHYQ